MLSRKLTEETRQADTVIDLSYIGEYNSTSSAGPLELISVDGDLATLQSPNGQTVQFDFGTKSFRWVRGQK